MKRIGEYKKLFGVEKDIELKSLKKAYRNLVKEWHPDKFQAGDERQAEAEIQSRKIIDGYHFLVSIAPETILANADKYAESISTGIADFQHKGNVLEITFMDGTTYEYFGVTKPIFVKMINSSKLNRFAKRSIYPNYTFRMAKRENVEA
ncbi:KTSC domain-containing protein [Psychroflexus sp. YR1-1]|uniref:KTSC domain-containing protein n=1 Tax=Psychroflexus aurantiacus TaxID=2709310 RepID=A0A6B3R182_9FLAO|nr:KTSC domain-containing protein [Psychroflexus aurantiacus]NEV94353.1 KTSC domain-containing protein [Psychroflexus aurantiacus]